VNPIFRLTSSVPVDARNDAKGSPKKLDPNRSHVCTRGMRQASQRAHDDAVEASADTHASRPSDVHAGLARSRSPQASRSEAARSTKVPL